MANLSSIARPYALAAFEYASNHHTLPAWKAFLATASYIARDPMVMKIANNPQISSEQLFNLFHEILATQLDSERKNFLLLLAQNKRLLALPEIAELFNAYYAALEKVSTVRVITAIDLEEDFRQKLVRALTKRVEREVTLQCDVDPAIIGGAIIHIGDRVIDGSIRGKLTRLLEFSLR